MAIKNVPEGILARHGMLAAPPELLSRTYKKVRRHQIQRRALFLSTGALAISLIFGLFFHSGTTTVSPESLMTSTAYIDEIITSVTPEESISSMVIYTLEDEADGIPELFEYENEGRQIINSNFDVDNLIGGPS
jgi:hypothetical protein